MTRTRRLWLTPAVAVVAVALYAVFALVAGQHLRREVAGAPATRAEPPAATSSPKPTYTIGGKIRLKAGEYTRQGQGCRSTKFAEDAQVVVADARGTSLTYAQVGAGQVTGGSCDLPFTLSIPAGEGSYGVDVPGWGLATYSEQELADTLDLTYG